MLQQRVEQPTHGAARRHHLPAAHAARAIEHKHNVARLGGAVELVRWNDGKRKRARLRSFGRTVGENAFGGLAGQRKSQDEIAIESFARLQADGQASDVVDDQAVQTRTQRTRQAIEGGGQSGRVERDFQRKLHRVGEAGQQHRRCNARGVGRLIGVGGNTGTNPRSGQRHARHITRRDDQRKAELGLAVGHR